MATNRLSLVAFAGLVAASIAAFFVTQHLKVTTPLIAGGAGAPRPVPAVINPRHPVQCGGVGSGSTTISFYLQHRSDDVIVSVVNAAAPTVPRTVIAPSLEVSVSGTAPVCCAVIAPVSVRARSERTAPCTLIAPSGDSRRSANPGGMRSSRSAAHIGHGRRAAKAWRSSCFTRPAG